MGLRGSGAGRQGGRELVAEATAQLMPLKRFGLPAPPPRFPASPPKAIRLDLPRARPPGGVSIPSSSVG